MMEVNRSENTFLGAWHSGHLTSPREISERPKWLEANVRQASRVVDLRVSAFTALV
jgi:hypothetical protein